jgi:hypothetical protein
LSSNPVTSIWITDTANHVPPMYDGTVIAADLTASQAIGLVRVNGNNGFGPYTRFALDGGIVAFGDQGLPLSHDYDRNSVALVLRASNGTTYDLIAAGTGDVGASRLRRLAGDTMNTVWTAYASGGNVGGSVPSNARALHDPIEVDVDGDGVEDVVFGGDDGFLYAVRAMDGSKVFAVDLGAPVDHVIAANIDLDPALELVASLADGRLVGLDDPGKYDAQQDQPDAGSDASPPVDAGSEPSDGGGVGETPGSPTSSGCGCHAGAGPGAELVTALGGLLAIIGVRRFPRRRGPRGNDARP